MICKECGAQFDDSLPACPYCGALHFAGAEKEYMKDLEHLKDDLHEMADDSEEAYEGELKKNSHLILKVALTLLVLFLLIVSLLFIFQKKMKEQHIAEAKAQLLWTNEYESVLDDLYAENQLDELLDFMQEHYTDAGYNIYQWAHYDYLSAYETYTDFISKSQNLDLSDKDDLTWCFYNATKLDYLSHYSSITFTETEQENLERWNTETHQFFTDTFDMTEADYNQMYAAICEEDYKYPSYKKIQEYIKENNLSK